MVAVIVILLYIFVCRWYIESGALDFFNHSELCTGRCKGRIPGKFGNSSPFPVAIRKSASPVVSQVSKINEDTYTSLPDHSEEKWKRVRIENTRVVDKREY